MVPAVRENDREQFDDAEELVQYLRDDAQPDSLQFVGDGDFGRAWIAWVDAELYFTSDSGLRIQNQSAFLFAQKCLDIDGYTVTPVSRCDVQYLDELVS